jgi:hypothetical protein
MLEQGEDSFSRVKTTNSERGLLKAWNSVKNIIELDNNVYPWSLLSTPVIFLSDEGNDTICSGAVHKGTLLMDHAKKRKLKSDVRRHDPITERVITKHLQKLVE